MVVLLPHFEGERVKTCACGAVGIGSPIRERSTFYVRRTERWGDGYRRECRRCTTDQSREKQRRRRARDPEGEAARRRRLSAAHRARHLEDIRRRDRESRAQRKSADPEAWRIRQREVQRDYIKNLRKDPARAEAARERNRMNYRGRREREGKEMKIAEVDELRSGVRLPVGPFRTWIEGLVEEEVRAGRENPVQLVASRLGLVARRVYAYLHEQAEVDEAVVDHATSREGRLSLYDLYPEQLDYEPAQMELAT